MSFRRPVHPYYSETMMSPGIYFIIQVATNGARQCLYKKAEALDSRGVKVFSTDNDILVDLVKRGSFAYLLDKTSQ